MASTLYTGEFYERLAHLFYAMAMADGKIVQLEKVRIRDLVEKDWSFKHDQTDSKKIIYTTLKKLIAKKPGMEEAFSAFSEFFIANRELFPNEVRNKIIDSSDRIAIAFGGRNKSESGLLYRLYQLLWK